MSRPKVFIPNKSFREYKGVDQYGDIVFLTEGNVNRFKVHTLYHQIWEKMEDAGPDDYLLVSSLSILNAIAASIMAFKFGRVNFLQFDNDRYVPREITLGDPPAEIKEEEDA